MVQREIIVLALILFNEYIAIKGVVISIVIWVYIQLIMNQHTYE